MAREPKPKKTRTTSTARAGQRKASERLAPAPQSEASSSGLQEEAAPGRTPEAKSEPPLPDLHARIRERAYLLFESSGYQHGRALDHWLEAERQVADSNAPTSKQNDSGK